MLFVMMPTQKSRLKTFLYYVLCWAVAVSIGTYFRLYPLFYYTSEDSYNKAAILVLSKLRATLNDRVAKKLPRASEFQKRRLTKQGFDYTLHSDSRMVRKSIDKAAKELDKSNPGKKMGPYLLEADPYNFYGLTKNIVRAGKISDTIKG